MKLKKFTSEPVRCSFCKEKIATHKIVGYPHYGRTSCKKCFDIEVEKQPKEREYETLGEEFVSNYNQI